MSNNNQQDSNQLTLLDILGFPSDQMLFSFQSKSLIYSLGSSIIHFNLSTNSKTFVQYLSNEIILLKYLDEQEKLLISIDNSLSPVICIWELPHFDQLYLKEIILSSEKNFFISNIFLEQMYPDVYLMCITSKIGVNYLFVIKNENELNNGFSIELFGKITGINEEIFGFKIFYNCSDAIFLLEKNLVYYNIDLDQESMNEKFKIDFPFRLINNSLQISRDINIISFLTIKGNCLIYDQNGNNKPSINPIGQEYFIYNKFERESICLGTNNGKIYIYNIYDNKPKYFINYNSILKIRHNYQLNLLNSESDYYNYYTSEEYDLGLKLIYLNEKYDEIFLRFKDNSILLSPLSLLIKDTQDNNNNNNNLFSREQNYFYSFNHSKKVDDIIIKDNKSLVFYSCAKDQKIIKYNIEYETNKLINSFFNLKEILSNNKFSSPSNNPRNNYNDSDKGNSIYITVLKCHPLYSNKLFAGDNKGFLYLFDTKENKFQYKRLIQETYEIVSLHFSPDGNFLSIGFDTGCQVFCNMKNNCQICLWLNNHYIPVEDSEIRKINNHVICYTYFFMNKEKHNNCILYLKNNYVVEYCKLYYDNNTKLNKRCLKVIKLNNQILDIKTHSSENYILILNNINQVVINQINSGIITAVIDLNNKVSRVNNIQVDNSGLFLSVLCELNNIDVYSNINNNKYNSEENISNKKNTIIIVEIGTGNVANVVNYINPINKMIFDNEGNYLIIAGERGEVSLWKLPGSMTYNIKSVLNEMKLNPYFWDDYEIKYDNINTKFRNDIINNSNYVINKKDRSISPSNQIKHDTQFKSKTYRNLDMKSSYLSNYITSNSNNSNVNFRRNKNITSDKSNEYNNELSKRNFFNDISKSNLQSNDYSNNIFSNKNDNISFKDNSNNFNSLSNFGQDNNNIKKAPLLIESNKLIQMREKEKEKINENILEIDNNFNRDNIKENEEMVNNDDHNKNANNNNIDDENKKHINNQFLRNRVRKENYDDINKNIEEKNDFIRKGINDNIFNEEDMNIKIKENININKNNTNNNIKNDFIQNKIPENTKNNINRNSPNMNKKTRNNSNRNLKNIINTTRPSFNKNNYNTFNYMGFNATNEKIPKLNYINIVNTHNNTENNYFQTFSNKNSQESYIMSFKEKRTEERQKHIKNAINQLLDNSLPLNTLEQEKNIQLTIQSKKTEKNLNENNEIIEMKNMLQRYNNEKNDIDTKNKNINNKNFNSISLNNMSENFVVINNQKIIKSGKANTEKNDNINAEIRKNIGMDKNKKYPEPDDIDENLVSSNLEPIPDLEQHNQIQKIEMDEINKQFEQNNNMNINNENKEDINVNKNLNKNENKEFYVKDRIVNNNLEKSFDEEN